MGAALLKGWIARGIGPLTVVEPKPSRRTQSPRQEEKAHAGRRAAAASKKFAACVIAVKPQILKTKRRALAAIAESGALMISIAAGTSTKLLSNAWGTKARIIRAMPNTPGAIGHGITGCSPPKAPPPPTASAPQHCLPPWAKPCG